MKKKTVFRILITAAILIAVGLATKKELRHHKKVESAINNFSFPYEKHKEGDFWVYDCPTPNVWPGKNDVKGIILHHTASPSARGVAIDMMNPKHKVSCHVIIDKDGTRYLMAPPKAITWHAGFSRLNGRNNCNKFTIGIEFQGNTLLNPLTDAQIKSAVEYMMPIIKEYKIPDSNIVTHEYIRKEYIKRYPDKKVPGKPDITQAEYKRVMKAIRISRKT